jgi:hypothetical protein
MAGTPSDQRVGAQVPPRELSQGFQQMLGRMIADPAFRKQMADNAEQALREAGIRLAPQEMERIRSMTPEDREKLSQETNAGDAKAWSVIIWRWVSWW